MKIYFNSLKAQLPGINVTIVLITCYLTIYLFIPSCSGSMSRPRCSVFIATSLDGYISRRDGSIDWLDNANTTVSPGEDCGYAEFMSTIDCIIMGRNTYEKVLSFPSWLYPVPVYVLTHNTAVPVHDNVIVCHDTPVALLQRLSAEGKRHVYVDGGITIQSFLELDLIDDIIITTIPILLGQGRPLFGKLNSDVKLSLVSSRTYPFGFVQSKYDVIHVK